MSIVTTVAPEGGVAVQKVVVLVAVLAGVTSGCVGLFTFWVVRDR